MDKLRSIFELREMLRQLERDVGFDDLSRTERDVLLAAHSLCDAPGDVISTEQIRSHTLVEPVAQATLYRAIRTLLRLGLTELRNPRSVNPAPGGSLYGRNTPR